MEVMKLADALRITQSASPAAPEFVFSLITGSTPEPLGQFIAAHLQSAYPSRKITIRNGLFGDLGGNLARYLEKADCPAALVVEWGDLDPRLGMRLAGRWGRDVAEDILSCVSQRLL